ncbi:hypothetical protein BDV29DRAFT_112192 [Aspergillus leporis]|uniref:BTB domain-containing protein n=1 Tax=Aspergillus leporis TaxID=41062 RepID=A0A5N5XG00_9EURO|nr:hypothetical protein BDV29DRAFT_112192 [Aspergillus leporis]
MHLDTIEAGSYIDAEVREYPQPPSSPYKAPIVTLIIGRDEYIIPEYYLRQFPQLRRSPKAFEHTFNPSLKFVSSLDIDEDIGHTLVHYLYTGEYETLRDSPDPSTPKRTTEYRRSVLVYLAARKYGLEGLESHAKHYMEVFDRDVPTSDILRIARSIYSRLPKDDTWFQEYVRVKVEDEFEADSGAFKRDWFLGGFGRDAGFDRLLVRIVVDVYSEKLAAAVDFGRFQNGGRHIVHSMANGDAVRIVEETIHEEPEPEEEEEEPAFEDVVPEVEPYDGTGSVEEVGVGYEDGDGDVQQEQEQEPVSDDWPLTPSPPPLPSSTSPVLDEDRDGKNAPLPHPESESQPHPEEPKDDDFWGPLRKRAKNKKKNKKLKVAEADTEPKAEFGSSERWPEVRHAASDESYVYAPPTPLSPLYEEPAPLPLRPASASVIEGTR